jgi:hypothetical protein
MGIFEALPLDGSSLSADVLAEKLDVEKDLLGTIFRALKTCSGSNFCSSINASYHS